MVRKPLMRSERFDRWATAHPFRGSLALGGAWGLGTTLMLGLLAGIGSLSPGDGLGFALVVAPLFVAVGVVLFGPILVLWTRRQDRLTRP